MDYTEEEKQLIKAFDAVDNPYFPKYICNKWKIEIMKPKPSILDFIPKRKDNGLYRNNTRYSE